MKLHLVKEPGPLLAYLVQHFAEMKKAKLKQLLTFGSIQVNGRIVTSHAHPLKSGDKLTFLSKTAAKRESIKRWLPFPIVFEDESIIVINKPAGLLTMATEKDDVNTAYFALTDYVRSATEGSGKKTGRIFIVHRLDRDASGLLVFAKTEAVKRLLQENWNDAVKKYYAVVEGTPRQTEGKIESYLAEDEFRRVYSTGARSRDAKHAETHYKVIDQRGNYSLLEVTLITGRKNQIRVHLSDLGHPIVGDEKYGSRSDPLKRLGLHAYHLSFRHPVTRDLAKFQTELPKDF